MTVYDSPDAEPADAIETLEPADVSRLRLGWWSRTDPAEMRRLLSRTPNLSVWIPDAHEYLLVSPWRHRGEVAHILEMVSVRYPVELTAAAANRAKTAGVRLFMAVEMSERRPDSFYRQAGLALLETVQSYELVVPRGINRNAKAVDIRPVEELSDEELRDLTMVDWGAFPWLWQNSRDEFRDYFAQTGVEIYLLRDQGAPVGYLGLTVFPGWGHIDRLAILPSKQGSGLGRALTEFAISRLIALGAVRVGLSTQHRNVRSQALYTHLGFRRQVTGDYRIFGRALWQNDSIDDLVMGDQE
jgi:ribosomal protein S18 acetylase RimI-like enzyme